MILYDLFKVVDTYSKCKIYSSHNGRKELLFDGDFSDIPNTLLFDLVNRIQIFDFTTYAVDVIER